MDTKKYRKLPLIEWSDEHIKKIKSAGWGTLIVTSIGICGLAIFIHWLFWGLAMFTILPISMTMDQLDKEVARRKEKG